MRMRIALRNPAMACPPRVPDADAAMRQRQLAAARHLLDRADTFAHFDSGRVHGRDPAGIVSTVLQPLQALDQKRRYRAFASDPDNAAHKTTQLETDRWPQE